MKRAWLLYDSGWNADLDDEPTITFREPDRFDLHRSVEIVYAEVEDNDNGRRRSTDY